MTWYINFLAWRQRIISLVCFANNAIHPWPQVMQIFDREMPPGFTPAICLRRNFVYISILENQGDKPVNQNFWNIVFNSHANFWEKLSKALTARPQKLKLSWILKQIFQDGGHRTCRRMQGGKHTSYNNRNPALGVLWSWHRVASPSISIPIQIWFLSGNFDLWSHPPMDHKETTHLVT